MERLLELRKEMNAKRPSFSRSNQHKRKRVARSSWRAPKGSHNKEKLGKAGKKPVVKKGYRGPAAVRGLSHEGKLPVLVHNMSELLALDPKAQCALVARVGMKKKLEMLNACKEKGIPVFDIKLDAALERMNKRLEENKKKREAVKKKQESKVKEKKESKKEAKKDEELSDDDKKDKERKDMEKLLTRREQ